MEQRDRMNAMFSAAAPPTETELTSPRGPEFWFMASEPPTSCETAAPDTSLSNASKFIPMERECSTCIEKKAGEQRLRMFVAIVVRSDLRSRGLLEPSNENLESIFHYVHAQGFNVAANIYLGGYVDEDFPFDVFYPITDPTDEDKTERLPDEIVDMHPELIPLRHSIHAAVHLMLLLSPPPSRLPLSTITASQLNISRPTGVVNMENIIGQDQENIPPTDLQQENVPPVIYQDQENIPPTNRPNRNVLGERVNNQELHHTNPTLSPEQRMLTNFLGEELPPTIAVNPAELIAIGMVPQARPVYDAVRQLYADWRQRNMHLLNVLPRDLLWPEQVFGF